MESMSIVLSKIIHGSEDFCFLCYRDVGTEATHADDFVVLQNSGTETLSAVLEYILGSEITNNAQVNSVLCEQCKTSAIDSYNFVKSCKDNASNMLYTVESITEACNNTIIDLNDYKTLFVTLNMDDFTHNQYYDRRCLKQSPSSVHKRLTELTDSNEQNKFNKHSKTRYAFKETDTYINAMTKKYVTNSDKINYDIPEIQTVDLVCDTNYPYLYKCKMCGRVFRQETKLRGHYFKKHYPRHVKCPKCPKTFISVEMLIHHNKYNHSGLICSQCGKEFTNKYILKKHEVNHNIQIMCQHCGRLYRSREAFQKHLSDNVCSQKARKSSDQAVHACNYCNKKFCYKPYLAKHIKHEHENVEGFKCRFCDKICYTPSGLKAHIVKHTLEKSFVCDQCDKRFVSKRSLLYHIRLHTGEQPYQCEYCERAFLSASRRLDHMRRHHLAPSLECDICFNKFKATNSLLKHKRRHFNPKSRLCTKYFQTGVDNFSGKLSSTKL